jgi:hypothetical protein
MKAIVVVGSNPRYPVPAICGGVWRASRYWPRGRTEVELLNQEADPLVSVPGHVGLRPDPTRIGHGAYRALIADARLEVIELIEPDAGAAA